MRIRFRLMTMLILAGIGALFLAAVVGVFEPGQVSIRNKSGEILVEHDEFVSVDWESQTFVVGDAAWDKLNLAETNLRTPFQLCVDDDVIYTGTISSPLSSFSLEGPVIQYPFDLAIRNSVTIQLGHPCQSIIEVANDPRFSRRVYNSFWWAGKLKATGR